MQQERSTTHYRNRLLEMLRSALARVEGAAAVESWLRANPLRGPLHLVAVGKAAQSMATGADRVLGGAIERALIVSKTGHLDPEFCRRRGWEAIEAAHPVPDGNSLHAGRRLLAFLQAGGRTPLLFLVSGGASSLVEAPVEGVDLDFLARTNRWLLGSGLDIVQMNRVRKGLSRIKGGGLLGWLQQRRVDALAISDVPGDRPSAIGSGLLVPEPGLAAGLAELSLPGWLRERVATGLDQRAEPPAQAPQLHIVANLEMAKRAAAERAKELGYRVTQDPRFLEGDAADTGRRLAAALREGAPGVTVWGGETTVLLPEHPGRGGRNQQLALAAATVLANAPDCYLLAAGTDGSDGPTQDAGALVDGESLGRAAVEGFDADRSLAAADAGSLLEAAGDLVTTGPTGTNVMDLVIGLKV